MQAVGRRFDPDRLHQPGWGDAVEAEEYTHVKRQVLLGTQLRDAVGKQRLATGFLLSDVLGQVKR